MARKDTREEVIEKFTKIHGTKYNYTNMIYIASGSPVEMGCGIHGTFWQQPRVHISGAGCPKCGQLKTVEVTRHTQEEVIKAFSYIHNDRYDYSLVTYTSDNIKVEIICKEHGSFWQLPYNHKIGNTCPKCANLARAKINRNNSTGWRYTNWEKAGKVSSNFDSYKVYIIQCSNDLENFYKIGKTFKEVNKRFSGAELPYSFTVIKIIEGNPREISELEIELQALNKEYKYVPSLDFNGKYECFSELKEETFADNK